MHIQNGIQMHFQNYCTTPKPYSWHCLSPYLVLMKRIGNSWRQAQPRTAVSSRAWNRLAESQGISSFEITTSHLIKQNTRLHARAHTHTQCYNKYIMVKLVSYEITLDDLLGPEVATNSSTLFWSPNMSSPCRGGLKLTPAAFFRGSPKRASNDNIIFPSLY